MHVHSGTQFDRSAMYDWRRVSPDLLAASLSGVIAGGVYIATMFPGLAAIGDTPKFQFVGAVLGTPHSPGYPLYMLLSWLFAQLPVGTIAYRINLMSGVFGAVAVALLYGVARQLGCRRWVAAACALSIGMGRVFWSQAILAEVYTLNALLFAGALLFLLRWATSRRDRDLVYAVAFVAAGCAHHLTIVMTIPALTAYALLVDARRVLSRRIVLSTAALALASVSLYGYVWLRTAHGAAFLEVQAHSIRDLVTIMRADTFDQFLGMVSLTDIVRERVPLVAGWIAAELGTAGLVLMIAGAAILSRRRPREAVLLGCATAAIVGFTLDYVVYDVEVFLLLAMIALGLMAGVGLEAVASAAQNRIHTRPVWIAMAVALAIGVPFMQFHANHTANDQHRHVYENELLDALFRALPDRSAIVRENYPVDHMLFYKLLAEHAAGARSIVLVAPDRASVAQYLQEGYHVYAFNEHRQQLQASGVQFVDATLGLPTARSLAHILDTESLTVGYPLGEATGLGPPAAVDPALAMRFNPSVRTRR
jgi:hypothetical protein